MDNLFSSQLGSEVTPNEHMALVPSRGPQVPPLERIDSGSDSNSDWDKVPAAPDRVKSEVDRAFDLLRSTIRAEFDRLLSAIHAEFDRTRSSIDVGTDRTLERNDTKFDQIHDRLDGISCYPEGVGCRLDGINARLDSTNARLDSINARLDNTTSRLDKMNAHPETPGRRLTEHTTASNENRLNDRLKAMEDRLKTRMAASDNNNLARLRNSHARGPGSPIVPLYDILTNTKICGFPKTFDEISELGDAQLDRYFDLFGYPSPRTTREKQQLLRKLAGQVVVTEFWDL